MKTKIFCLRPTARLPQGVRKKANLGLGDKAFLKVDMYRYYKVLQSYTKGAAIRVSYPAEVKKDTATLKKKGKEIYTADVSFDDGTEGMATFGNWYDTNIEAPVAFATKKSGLYGKYAVNLYIGKKKVRLGLAQDVDLWLGKNAELVMPEEGLYIPLGTWLELAKEHKLKEGDTVETKAILKGEKEIFDDRLQELREYYGDMVKHYPKFADTNEAAQISGSVLRHYEGRPEENRWEKGYKKIKKLARGQQILYLSCLRNWIEIERIDFSRRRIVEPAYGFGHTSAWFIMSTGFNVDVSKIKRKERSRNPYTNAVDANSHNVWMIKKNIRGGWIGFSKMFGKLSVKNLEAWEKYQEDFLKKQRAAKEEVEKIFKKDFKQSLPDSQASFAKFYKKVGAYTDELNLYSARVKKAIPGIDNINYEKRVKAIQKFYRDVVAKKPMFRHIHIFKEIFEKEEYRAESDFDVKSYALERVCDILAERATSKKAPQGALEACFELVKDGLKPIMARRSAAKLALQLSVLYKSDEFRKFLEEEIASTYSGDEILKYLKPALDNLPSEQDEKLKFLHELGNQPKDTTKLEQVYALMFDKDKDVRKNAVFFFEMYRQWCDDGAVPKLREAMRAHPDTTHNVAWSLYRIGKKTRTRFVISPIASILNMDEEESDKYLDDSTRSVLVEVLAEMGQIDVLQSINSNADIHPEVRDLIVDLLEKEGLEIGKARLKFGGELEEEPLEVEVLEEEEGVSELSFKRVKAKKRKRLWDYIRDSKWFRKAP